MKRLFFFLLLTLTACGGAELDQIKPDTPSQQFSPPLASEDHVEPGEQVFNFEDFGDLIVGMHVSLKRLESGNWLVASREGHVELVSPGFLSTKRLFSIPTSNYGDSGLTEMEVENNNVFIYHTILPDGDFDQIKTELLKFSIDEDSEEFLQNKQVVATFTMTDLSTHHQGGGMAIGEDGYLYIGIGDGTFADNYADSPAQDLNSPLGKIFRVNPETLDMEIAAVGVRNPFTMIQIPGGIAIGDVGNDKFEEINILPTGSQVVNFGWPIQEGPGEQFTPPAYSFAHCTEELLDEDPYGHTKAMTKNHGGVVHPCNNQIITVLGFMDGEIIYSEAYYGLIRGFNPVTKQDRHLAHMPGMTDIELGADGEYYGITMFATPYIQHLLR